MYLREVFVFVFVFLRTRHFVGLVVWLAIFTDLIVSKNVSLIIINELYIYFLAIFYFIS